MKKLISPTLALFALTLAAKATIIMNEPFAYADGGLTNVSSGVWTNHSGANSGSVTVTSGHITLVTTAAEDVMRSLGASYSNQTLYVSFKLNLSVLPTATTYFAHFAQNSSTFRSRIWSLTNGAASGRYRLGITSSVGTAGAWVSIATDLDPGAEYKVVMRFVGGTNATLWIAPTSEASVVNRADGADATTLGSWLGQFFAFRQSSGMGTMTIDDLLIGTQFSDVQTVGGPPSISGLVPVSIPANTNTGPMAFLVSDFETATSNLTVTATSSNPTLVPNNPANLTLGGPYTNSTLTVTPASNQQGTSSIEVVVTDGSGFKATNTFTITVGEPSISHIANQMVLTNVVLGPVPFSVNDKETSPGSLTLTATSDNQTVLPDASIFVENAGGTNRNLYLTNAAAGVSHVTVTVNDGTFNRSTTFTLSVNKNLGLILTDDFSYADGPVTTNSGLVLVPPQYGWATHSGATGETHVVNGKLLLKNTASEDVNRWFDSTFGPANTDSGLILYSRFIVTLKSVPTQNGVGENFALFKEAGNQQFRARLLTTTNGVPKGKYRLAISAGSFVTTVFLQDLSPGAAQVVITRYNTATGESTLWVNPASASELSTSVHATDGASPVNIYSYAFRQSTGIGDMSIDGLRVATTFADVYVSTMPSSESIQAGVIGANQVFSWSDPNFSLASSTNIAGPYTPIPTATSPSTNAMTGPQNFFRLVWP